MVRSRLVCAGMFSLVGVLAACGDDDPAGGQRGNGTVSGTVHFLNSASWPATGDVQVAVFSTLTADYLPGGAPDAFTNPIAPGTTDFSYQLTGLSAGTYAAVYVSWRDPANPAGATVLGVYWDEIDSLGVADDGSGKVVPVDPAGPRTVTITSADPTLDGIDIVADVGLAP